MSNYASCHTFVFSNVHASERGRVHTHARASILTHSTVVSVSVTANQTPAQTPASYLATPLHFIVMLLKATTKKKSWGVGEWGGGWRERERGVKEAAERFYSLLTSCFSVAGSISCSSNINSHTFTVLPGSIIPGFLSSYFSTCLFLCHSSSPLTQGAILVYQNHWGWFHLSSRNIKEDGQRLLRWIKKAKIVLFSF